MWESFYPSMGSHIRTAVLLVATATRGGVGGQLFVLFLVDGLTCRPAPVFRAGPSRADQELVNSPGTVEGSKLWRFGTGAGPGGLFSEVVS